jgi:hypothetical protein
VKISKINRYDGQYIDGSVGRPLALCENGDYVLYAVARAREDALLEALKSMFESHCLNTGHSTRQTCPICIGPITTRQEIERTR